MTSTPPRGLMRQDLLLRCRRDPNSAADLMWISGPHIEPAATQIPHEFTPSSDLLDATDTAREAGESQVPKRLGAELLRQLPEPIKAAVLRYLEDDDGVVFCRRLVLDLARNCNSLRLPWEDLQYAAGRPVKTRRLEIIRYVEPLDPEAKPPGERPPQEFSRDNPYKVLLLVGSQDQERHKIPADRALSQTLKSLTEQFQRPDLRGVIEFTAAGYQESIDRQALRHLPGKDELLGLLERDLGFDLVIFLGHSDAGVWPDFPPEGLMFPAPPPPPPPPPRGGSADRSQPPDVIDGSEIATALSKARTRLVLLCNCHIDRNFAETLLASVDQVVGMAARLFGPLAAKFCSNFVQSFIDQGGGTALDCPHFIGGLIATTRTQLDATQAWIPSHWTRNLWDDAFLGRHAKARYDHRVQVQSELPCLPPAISAGLDTGGLFTEIYVELSTGSDGRIEKGRDGDRSLFDSLFDIVCASHATHRVYRDRFVLLAEPGAGKTTVLRELARRLASDPGRGLLPIYVSAQELVDADVNGPSDLAALCPAFADAPLALTSTRSVVLVDGLDEVDDVELARQRIGSLANTLGTSILLVASRKDGYGGVTTTETEFLELGLQPLSDPSRDDLIIKWCRLMQPKKDAWFKGFRAHPTPKDAAAAVRKVITESRAGTEIARNPLGVTLLIRLIAERDAGDQLPTTRAQIYEEMILCLVGQEQRSAKLPDAAMTQASAALQHLAWWLTERGRTELRKNRAGRRSRASSGSVDEYETFLASLTTAVPDLATATVGAPWQGARGFLTYLSHRAGLFVEKSARCHGFAIRPFQDVLAALAFVERHDLADGAALAEAAVAILASAAGAGTKGDGLRIWGEVFALVTDLIEPEQQGAWLLGLAELGDAGRDLAYTALGRASQPNAVALIKILGLDGANKQRQDSIERIPRLEIEEERRLDLLVAAVHALSDRFVLGVLAEVLESTPWSDPKLRQRGRAAVDDRLSEFGAPDWNEFDWCEIPLPAEAGLKPGVFMMGSPPEEKGRSNDETLHPVRLTEAFAMTATTVTVGQYRKFKGDHRQRFQGEIRAIKDVPDGQPVTNVTHFEASLYARWLSVHRDGANAGDAERRSVQLPSEAQWEWAARGGLGSRPHCLRAGQKLSQVAWLGEPGAGNPHPVGELVANPYGLHDMHGNVWEWCRDWYADYPTSRGAATNHGGPPGGARRVLRGGSYWLDAHYCRSAYRYRRHPAVDVGFGLLGFRVVLAAAAAPELSTIEYRSLSGAVLRRGPR